MIRTDYFSEYYGFIDQFLADYTTRLQETCPDIYKLGEYSAQLPVISFLHLTCAAWGWREIYVRSRKEGKSQRAVKNSFSSWLDTCYPYNKPVVGSVSPKPLKTYDFYREMRTYRRQPMVYLREMDQLEYLIPLTAQFDQPVTVISELNIRRPDFPGHVAYLKTNIFEKECYSNSFLKQNFSPLFNFFNKFDLLLQMINPSCIIVLNGNHYQDHILSLIGKKYAIPTIALQQQWPLPMSTGFCQMTYDYYLTWGEYFNPLWKKFSRIPQYVPVGHAQAAVPVNEKDKITFFVDPPVCIDADTYYRELTALIENCAQDSPEQQFWVKDIDDRRLPDEYLKEILAYPNVSSANCYSLPEIYSKTELAVSYFTQVLVDSMVHDCIPLVFEAGLDFSYYPDLEEEGVGLMAPDMSVALGKISGFIDDSVQREKIRVDFRKGKGKLFKATANEAARNISTFIKKIS